MEHINLEKRTMNRKDFFKSTGRKILWGVLAGLGGFWAYRRYENRDKDPVCEYNNKCARCRAAQKCALPQAIAFRKE